MPRQLALMELPKRKRRVMMHVADGGQGHVRFECNRCGHDTGWMRCDETDSVTKLKRGEPCPRCNN
jgi:hypothetical protein